MALLFMRSQRSQCACAMGKSSCGDWIMRNQVAVSIIIPAFNEARELVYTLEHYARRSATPTSGMASTLRGRVCNNQCRTCCLWPHHCLSSLRSGYIQVMFTRLYFVYSASNDDVVWLLYVCSPSIGVCGGLLDIGMDIPGMSMAARAATGITTKGRIMSWSSCSSR